jgi:hypothetical protein
MGFLPEGKISKSIRQNKVCQKELLLIGISWMMAPRVEVDSIAGRLAPENL